MKSSWLIRFIVVGVLGLIVVFVLDRPHESNGDANPNVARVARQDLTQRVTISGQVWPEHRLDIKPPFNGYITKIYVKIGDRLKRGAPIVTFSPSLSEGEINHPIRAGFDGIVTQVLRTEGEYVLEAGDQNNLVIRMEDFSNLYILGSVPELDIAKVKVGEEAMVRVSSLVGEIFKGKIIEMGLSAKDKDRYGSSTATEFQIRVKLDSHDPRLLPGMSAVMDVIAEKREKVLSLAHEFVQEDDKGFFVTTDRGSVKRVTIGMQTAEAVEIKEGLNEGDKVRAIDFLNLPKLKD